MIFKSYSDNNFAKFGLIAAAILILSNYYYFYFYDFAQGQILGSNSAWFLTKIMALMIFYSLLLSPVLRTRFRAVDIILFLTLCYFLIIILLRRMVWDTGGGYMVFNMFMCVIPFFIFERNKNIGRIFFFLDACLIILILQVFIDTSIFLYGSSLWENNAFIGGMGNPSSFGIICSIFLAYNLFLSSNKLFKLIVSTVLLYGILMTSSMMSLFMAVLVIFTWIWTLKKTYFLILLVLSVLIAIYTYEHLLSNHLIYKLHSLFLLDVDDPSRSVSLRIENYDLFFDQLINNFMKVLLWGYDDTFYYIADSQYLTFIGNFGLLFSLIFFATYIWYGLIAYRMKNMFGYFSVLVLVIFMLVFFTNRILDYYPVPLILFLTIMLPRSINRDFG